MEKSVGIRELKQNPSAVLSQVKAGEEIVITERGKPVARLSPIRKSFLEELVDSGRVKLPKQPSSAVLAQINPTELPPGAPTVLESLEQLRRDRL